MRQVKLVSLVRQLILLGILVFSGASIAASLIYTSKPDKDGKVVTTPYSYKELVIREGNQLWLVNKYNSIRQLSNDGNYDSSDGRTFVIRGGVIVQSEGANSKPKDQPVEKE